MAGLVRLPLLALIVLLAGGPAYGDAAGAIDRCAELLPGLRDGDGPFRQEIAGGDWGGDTAVRLGWTEAGSLGRPRAGWLVCWFYPRAGTNGAWQFIQVQSSRYGLLGRYDIQQLYKFLRVEGTVEAPLAPHPRTLYVLQQAINALSLGCVYALVAVAFTLVYGITNVINLAFGELAMVGAMTTFLGSLVIAPLAWPFVPTGALLLLPVAALTVAAWGLLLNGAVFHPLRRAGPSKALIGTLGFAIALEELVRLLQGPRTQWLPFNPDALVLVSHPGFDVVVSRGHLFAGAGTLALTGLLWWASARSTFGRLARAVAEDAGTAGLIGVDVARVTALTIACGAALAGIAGSFAAGQYGSVDAAMGAAIGFKALAAAVLGGIGSAPGAILGAMAIAVAETAGAATIGSAWKDVTAFAVLVTVLVFRPQGLLGRASVDPP